MKRDAPDTAERLQDVGRQLSVRVTAPPPQESPQQLAAESWWRRLFAEAVRDWRDR